MGKVEKEEKQLINRLRGVVVRAINKYGMIEEGDKVMVCLSGGKDSYTMLDILMHLQRTLPYKFDIVAVNLDQKQPGYPEHILPEYLASIGVDFRIVEKDTYSIVKDKIPEGKTMCSLCSRLRRGNLYSTAKELNATKIALGHHREDIIETFFLNLFFAGKMETMPPKYLTDNGEHIVIRPLAFCKENEIETYAALKGFPIIPCNLCGSQPKLQRQMIKQMVKNWEKEYPGRTESIFGAISNIAPSHMLDTHLFNFQSVKRELAEAGLFDDSSEFV